jgi:hypothetical protein
MTRGPRATRGRWASLAVFCVYAPVGLGGFLWLGWTWRGLAAFFATYAVGSLIADRVFDRIASAREKQAVMEERVRDSYD